jgi:hypothetical protein
MFCNTLDGGEEFRIFHDFQVCLLQRRELVMVYLRTLRCCMSQESIQHKNTASISIENLPMYDGSTMVRVK